MPDHETIKAYIKRLRRKVEILRLENKSRGYCVDDANEALTLIDRLEELLG